MKTHKIKIGKKYISGYGSLAIYNKYCTECGKKLDFTGKKHVDL